jgi:hypothetical protein
VTVGLLAELTLRKSVGGGMAFTRSGSGGCGCLVAVSGCNLYNWLHGIELEVGC